MTKTQSRILLFILLGYTILAISYALATPPLEASDEYKHYPVVQYIQTTGRLPVLDPEEPGRWLQEAAQPPLYYVLMAGLTIWIDTSDLQMLHQINPHAFVGDPNQIANKNLIIHQPDLERFPWHGTVLALYVIRIATIMLGIGTIIIVAHLGRLLFGSRAGLFAAALTAFNPMFLFVHAAVNNDGLSILIGNLGLLLLVKLWRDEPDPRRNWRRYAALGLLLGFGLMTKLSLAGLFLLTGVILAGLSFRRKEWRILLIGGFIVTFFAMIISLPWFVRNFQVYGDPTAMRVFVDVQDTRSEPITWQGWRGEFGTFYRSFWGLFGGVNIAMPETLYDVYNLLFVAGVIGFAGWFWRQWRSGRGLPAKSNSPEESGNSSPGIDVQARPWTIARRQRGWWLLALWPALMFVLLIRWNILSPAFQGRLMFPALGAVNILWAVGLLAWIQPSWQPRAIMALSGLFFAAAAVLPWAIIRPAYAIPKPLVSAPEAAQFGPLDFRSGDDLVQLVGVEMRPNQSVTPGGDPIEVVLYWRAGGSIEQDYLSVVHLLGRQNRSVGYVNRYPARGMIPTSFWQSGQIWRDVYHVYVSGTAAAPARLKVKVSLYDTQTQEDLEAYGPDGLPIPLVVVGEARLAAGEQKAVAPENPLNVSFTGGVALGGYDQVPQPVTAGDNLDLTLYWQAAATLSLDYTVFVHFLDGTGELVANADGPPLGGDYPTHFWQAGEQIIDRHVVELPADLPAGSYEIAVGLYNPDTLARLTRLDGQGDSVRWSVRVEHER